MSLVNLIEITVFFLSTLYPIEADFTLFHWQTLARNGQKLVFNDPWFGSAAGESTDAGCGHRATDCAIQSPHPESSRLHRCSVESSKNAPNLEQITDDCSLLHSVASACCNMSGLQRGKLIVLGCGEMLTDMGGGAVRASRLPPIVGCFDLGCVHEMAGHANAISQRPGYNVYRSLAVYDAPNIGANQRRTAKDVIFYFGVCCDLDADKNCQAVVEDLPQATIVVGTSSNPKANFQLTYLLNRPVTEAEARLLSAALAKRAGDADNLIGDPTHAWRGPGTLNWPKKSKVGRGRPLQPQLATLDDRGTGRLVSPEELATSLGVDLIRFKCENRKPQQQPSSKSTSPKEQSVVPRWSADNFDASEHHSDVKLLRLLEALKAIPADVSRPIWRAVIGGLCDFFRGAPSVY